MAYPTVDKPYGLKPVNRVDGLPYAGATRQIQIASGYATDIGYGDLVQIDTNGQCIRSAVTTSTSTYIAGVFLGCTYTNPSTKQKLFSSNWPASTVASDAMAYIVDDPNATFKVACVSAGTTMSTLTRAAIGANVAVINNAPNSLGNSQIGVDTTTGAGTTSLVLRVIDVVPDTAVTATTFSEVIVKINLHQYNNTTGI